MPKKVKSSQKTLRTDKKKQARNLKTKKTLRALLKNLAKAIELKEEGKAKELLLKANALLDRTASRGVIHKNNAGRKKSRLARQVKKLSVSSS